MVNMSILSKCKESGNMYVTCMRFILKSSSMMPLNKYQSDAHYAMEEHISADISQLR